MGAGGGAGVKVLLDGQGGDEVFGGYGKFRYAYLASLLRSGRWVGLAKEFGATVLQGDRYVLNIRNGYRYLPRRLRRMLGVDSLLRRGARGGAGGGGVGGGEPAAPPRGLPARPSGGAAARPGGRGRLGEAST